MEKRIFCRVILRLCAAALPLMAVVSPVLAQHRAPVPMPTICPDSVMKHIVELSSETYEGRLAGSEGYDRAVRYVEKALRRYGVRELKQQPFVLECNEVENCKFNIYTPGSKEKRVFTLGNEFCCAGMTGRGYVDAQMVFCGYGVDHGVFNEYKGVDVQGKIVVVLTGLPEWMPASVGDNYQTLRDKARTAERHGAIGMLAINISPSCMPYEPQGRVYCGELPHLATFPILQLTMDCGRELLTTEQTDLDAAIHTLDGHQVSSFALLKKAEIDVNARYRQRATTMNVSGLLEGKDKNLRKEIIVVGASLDGTGIQGVIIQGGNDTPWHMAVAGKLITDIIALFHGWRYRSDFCTKVTLGSCLKAFPDDPAGWITRRSEVLERYKDDPFCGYTFTLNGYHTLAELALRAGSKKLIAKIPKDLPMFILSGAEDPVGEMGKGVQRMYELYKACGMKNVTLDIRPGDRHELHNEEDRYQVFEEIKDFVYGGVL